MHVLENLKVWKKAMDVVEMVYNITASFPAEERFGLTSQMRRSAVSLPSNIAEGAGRNSNKQFINFLNFATGSAYELQTQLVLSNRLGFVNTTDIKVIIDKVIEVQKMNYSLIKSLE